MGAEYSEAQKRASLKYMSQTVAIQLRVTKEQREKYRAKAEAKGLSLAKYFIDLAEKDCN